jgi:hypothetical protein
MAAVGNRGCQLVTAGAHSSGHVDCTVGQGTPAFPRIDVWPSSAEGGANVDGLAGDACEGVVLGEHGAAAVVDQEGVAHAP